MIDSNCSCQKTKQKHNTTEWGDKKQNQEGGIPTKLKKKKRMLKSNKKMGTWKFAFSCFTKVCRPALAEMSGICTGFAATMSLRTATERRACKETKIWKTFACCNHEEGIARTSYPVALSQLPFGSLSAERVVRKLMTLESSEIQVQQLRSLCRVHQQRWEQMLQWIWNWLSSYHIRAI